MVVGCKSVHEGVVEVEDGRGGLHLEVSVGAEGRGGLAWAPVHEGWLGVVEPVVAQVLHVPGVHVGKSLGDFASGDSSSELEDLFSDSEVDLLWLVLVQQVVVHLVSGSDDLGFLEVVGLDGHWADSGVVHVSGEDLVSEEVVAPETAVRVSEVVGIVSGDINELSEDGVEGVVLLLSVVQVAGVLVDSVVAVDFLEELEGPVVSVVVAWGIVEHSDVGVVHLVVSHHLEGWGVDGLLRVVSSLLGTLLEGSELLLDLLDDGLVVNITSGDDDDVVSNVVSSSILSDGVGVNLWNVVEVTLLWLTKVVVSEGVEVSIFNRGFLVLLVHVLKFVDHILLSKLELSIIDRAVNNHIS